MSKEQESTIDFKLADSIRRLKIVRKSRINTSERLGNYSSKWEMYLLVFSILSTILLVISIGLKDETTSRKIISGCFSMYTIILQYFVSTLNYRERALKFDYHQLEIENLIQDFQNIECEDEEIKKNKYPIIMEKYQILLQGQENHSDLDYRKANKEDSKYTRDFSLDNIFVNLQPIIGIVFVLFYIYWNGGQ
ncbi:SLATT domain-containing protein [Streptococcus saliviloxodontae]|uniref:SMODS and SLOG-associating 2TM effector domain-containing protein n=1 Tax=Streptococcus saliviloxodontae TaxID=1349416 RepID=A0ABS2PMH6_9STRE|nr:SLATT domain-containing protein [Streptococcus saliviloxodontae]MBM7636634.1 hypothetical protein [Streptococcus saliviloxodontae]